MTPPDRAVADRFRVRHIVAQAGWAGTFEIVGLVLRYGVVVLIARMFGAYGLGIYTLAIAVGSAAALVGRAGLDRAAMRFTAYHRARNEAAEVVGVNAFASIVTVCLATGLALAVFAAAEPIAGAWSEPRLASGLRTIAVGIPAIALGEVWRDGLRGFQDVRLAAVFEKVMIPGTTALLMLGLVILEPRQPLIPITASVAAYWLAAISAGLVLRRSVLSIRSKASFDVRPWLGFAFFLSLEGGLLYLLQWSDQLLLGLLMNVTDVGIYAAAVRVASVTAVPLLAVNVILAPTVAALFGAGRTFQLRQTYARLTWATAIAGVLVGGALVAMGPLILGLFGAEFLLAYPALVILVCGHAINAGTGSAGVILGMTGHVRWRLFNAGVTAILNVVLNLLFIPMWGIAGSALATALSIAVINMLQVGEVRLVLGFWGYGRRELVYWFDRIKRLRRDEPASAS